MDNNDLDVLARTLYGEAKAGDENDAYAIGHVIINRAVHKKWPDKVAEVCLQPYQFSCWLPNDPNCQRIKNAKGKWFERCKQIASHLLLGMQTDPTKGSTHYHTPAVKPSWSRNKIAVYHTKGHLFFNDIDTKSPKI